MKKNSRILLLALGISLIAVIAAFVAISSKGTASGLEQTVSAETIHVSQDIIDAKFESQQEFPLRIEQAENTPLRILDSRVNVISPDYYTQLTGQKSAFSDVITKPKMLLQNVSDKNIVGVTVFISDKEAGTKFGVYFKKVMIQPGKRFVILPENFVPASENPAKDPKFWLTVKNKSQIAVRVAAFFEDGSLWANN